MASVVASAAALLFVTVAHAVSVPPYGAHPLSAARPLPMYAPEHPYAAVPDAAVPGASGGSDGFFYGDNLNHLSHMTNAHAVAAPMQQTARPTWQQIFHVPKSERYISFSYMKTSKSLNTMYGLECVAPLCGQIIGYQCPNGANGPELVDDGSPKSEFVGTQGVHCRPSRFVSQIFCEDIVCSRIAIRCLPLSDGYRSVSKAPALSPSNFPPRAYCLPGEYIAGVKCMSLGCGSIGVACQPLEHLV